MTIDYSKTTSPPDTGAAAKVVLTKNRPSISLTKQTGSMRINLNWTSQPESGAPRGFLKRLTAPRGIDLDLGCLYELTDGTKGVVQALGNSFGHLDRPPFILLNGDDRSGANVNGEDLFINLAQAAAIRRILVFACIYDGAANFDQANGVVTLSADSGAPIEVALDERANGARMCAVALIESDGGQLIVNREVRYIQGAQDALDQAYGWGMRWAAGRK